MDDVEVRHEPTAEEQVEIERLSRAASEGILAGMRLMGFLGSRLSHLGKDGSVHAFPRADGSCQLCSDCLELRISKLGNEDVTQMLEDIDAKILQSSVKYGRKGGPTQGWKSKVDDLQALLMEGEHTLQELMVQSGLSRASIMRRLPLLNAKKVKGSGVGRRVALYTIAQGVDDTRSRESGK